MIIYSLNSKIADGFMFQVAELEAQSVVSASGERGSEELTQSMAEMEALIKAKDEVHSPKTFKINVDTNIPCLHSNL